MDEYLKEGANFQRLLKEYNEHKSLVVAFDFDNTIYDFHHKGETFLQIMQLLRDLKGIGCYMICWTANPDRNLIVEYLAKHNIPCDSINENPPFFQSPESKIYYNVLIDDRSGLIQTYNELKQLLTIITNKNEKH